MDNFRPLSAVLFFYECFRVLLLAVFWYVTPLVVSYASGTNEGFFYLPYFVYLSANALFPLMALFVWLRPAEYGNYLTLYMAGKVIGVVTFYAWEIFSSREFPGAGNLVLGMVLLGAIIFVSLADILSVWGAWTLKNKFRHACVQSRDGKRSAESGGV